MQENIDRLISDTREEVRAVLVCGEITSAMKWHRADWLHRRAAFVVRVALLRSSAPNWANAARAKAATEDLDELSSLLEKSRKQFQKKGRHRTTHLAEVMQTIADIKNDQRENYNPIDDGYRTLGLARSALRNLQVEMELNPDLAAKDLVFVSLCDALFPQCPVNNQLFGSSGFRRLAEGLLLGHLLTVMSYTFDWI
jgi:hypothetical protein